MQPESRTSLPEVSVCLIIPISFGISDSISLKKGTGYVPVEASQLHQCIEQFKQELPEIPPMNSSRVDLIPGLLMIHIIAHCATVQLFQSRESQGGRVDTESKTARAITSAVWLLRQIDYSRIKHVDAFLGVSIHVH